MKDFRHYFDATATSLAVRGWVRWNKESDLYLCPIAEFDDLPDGIALHSISGLVAVKGRDDIDKDTRGGFLAYGIIPGKTRTDVTAEQVATAECARRAVFTTQLASLCADTGCFDLASGKMLYGEDAADAIRDIATAGRRGATS